MKLSIERRFRRRVGEPDPETGCWPWLGRKDHRGYGRFYVAELGKYVPAHRWLWIFCHGPIPAGLEPHHTCHRRDCVNIHHLQLLPHREHLLLHGGSERIRGMKNPAVQRTPAQVLGVKLLHRLGVLPINIARLYPEIPQRSVYAIIRGEAWSWLDLPPEADNLLDALERQAEAASLDSEPEAA